MLLKLSTARSVVAFMADASDHVTGKTGLTLTITASKDGAAFASITPTVTELVNGWYKLALTASHTDTLGDLALHVTGSGADPSDLVRQVVTDLPGESVASVANIATALATANGPALPTGTVVADGGNSATTFVTSRTEATTDYWKDALVLLTSGVLAGQVKKATGYDGSTKALSFTSGFTGTPANGVTFALINR